VSAVAMQTADWVDDGDCEAISQFTDATRARTRKYDFLLESFEMRRKIAY